MSVVTDHSAQPARGRPKGSSANDFRNRWRCVAAKIGGALAGIRECSGTGPAAGKRAEGDSSSRRAGRGSADVSAVLGRHGRRGGNSDAVSAGESYSHPIVHAIPTRPRASSPSSAMSLGYRHVRRRRKRSCSCRAGCTIATSWCVRHAAIRLRLGLSISPAWCELEAGAY